MAKKAKGGGGDEAPAKKSPKMKIIIGVVGLAAAWKLGVLPIGQSKPEADASGTTTTTAVVEGAVVEVGDPITVNLADTDVAHYARVAVALVLNEHPSEEDEEAPAEEGAAHKGATVKVAANAASGGGEAEVDPTEAVADRFAAVQNMVIVEIRSWTYAELMAPDALAEVQDRLTEQVQEIYEHDEVVRVVFTQFVVQ